MATTSTATAVWEGKLRDGKGTFKAGSGAFGGSYTFATRFEGAKGATPEELIAAAHAACFSMALSAGLEKAGTPATRIETQARCTIDTVDGAPKITTIALSVRMWCRAMPPRSACGPMWKPGLSMIETSGMS